MADRPPAFPSQHYGYNRGRNLLPSQQSPYGHALATPTYQAFHQYHSPQHYKAATPSQQHAVQPHRRKTPQLPVELWMKVIAFLPRRELITALFVCRMFKEIAWKTLLDIVYVHLENDGTPDSIAKANILLYNIATKPTWAKYVKNMVVFMDDQRTFNHVNNLLCAVARLPHLRTFKLMVTAYYTDEFPEMHGSIRRVVDTLFQCCHNLEELVVPHTMVWDAISSMARQPRLRRLTTCSRLGADMQITDDHARRFVQGGQDLLRHSRGHQCLDLTTLCIDFNVIDAVPQQVFSQLTELEIYNLDNAYKLFNNVLAHARRLQSLTLHEYSAPSNGIDRSPPAPGEYLKPNEQDRVELDLAGDTNGDYGSLTPLTPKAGDRHDPLRRLTSFRYIAYRGVMSARVCKSLLLFLERRTGLRRVDIKAVIVNKHYAEKTLHALRKMPYLEVLGFEFRDVRDGLNSGLELLRYIPRTVAHLKYNVIGWNLTQAPTVPDTVVKRALDKCPQLQFLYVYDGIQKINGRSYQRNDDVRLSTPLPHFDFKRLRFLGLEHNWMDITRDFRGMVNVAQWPVRQCFYSALEGGERLGEKGEWLMRHNRDLMDLSTYA